MKKCLFNLSGGFVLMLSTFLGPTVLAQCTIAGTGSISWNNAAPPSCQEGGNAGSTSVIIIPADVILNFNGNTDTWTGVRIEIYGRLRISAAGQVTINSNIEVKNGGTLQIDSKLVLGSSAGCGYNIVVRTGGTVDIAGSTPDRLIICGTEIARGGTAGCNSYPDGPLPYCESGSGFTGPFAFDETGVNNALPVTLLYFQIETTAENNVRAWWSTATEKNASHFVLERSIDGRNFTEVASVAAAGESITKRDYSITDNQPLIGRSYYRLKEVDFDGYIEHFGIRMASVTGKKSAYVYPNPMNEADSPIVGLNFSSETESRVRVTDLSGREVKRFSFTGATADLNEVPMPGVYILTINTGSETYVTRFVVR